MSFVAGVASFCGFKYKTAVNLIFAVLFWLSRWSSRVTASRRTTDPRRPAVTEHSGVDSEHRQVVSRVF